MNKRFYAFAAFLVLVIISLACASLVGGNGAPSSQDQVATVVALTMQALTPAGSDGTATAAPESVASILPHSLYFLSNGSGGTMQIFRMEKDGKTIRQVTAEPSEVGPYDISAIDGRVAYVANNQLILINPDGSTRTVLVDGGPVDPNNPIVDSLGSPVWSNDGKLIAYAHHGLSMYSLVTGATTLLLIGYYEGGTLAIYYPDSGAVVRLSGSDNGQPCCNAIWTPDSASLYTASPYLGMISSGLWQFNASDGKVTTLLPTQSPDGTYNFAQSPFIGPDGQLYFFYVNLKDIPDGRTPLQLVRSGLDGVTGRIVISDKSFLMMNEALWSPDAQFVITADAPTQDVYQGGVPAIIYLDGRPEIQLAEYAMQLKWGP